MHEQKILFLIITCIFVIGLMAEEGNAEQIILSAKKIGIKSVGIYGGFGAGILGGAFFGCAAAQNEDTLQMRAAKIGILVILGGACGTMAGKSVAHKYIDYYHPEKPELEPKDQPHLTENFTSDRII